MVPVPLENVRALFLTMRTDRGREILCDCALVALQNGQNHKVGEVVVLSVRPGTLGWMKSRNPNVFFLWSGLETQGSALVLATKDIPASSCTCWREILWLCIVRSIRWSWMDSQWGECHSQWPHPEPERWTTERKAYKTNSGEIGCHWLLVDRWDVLLQNAYQVLETV